MPEPTEIATIVAYAQAHAGVTEGLESQMELAQLGPDTRRELRYKVHTVLSSVHFQIGIGLLRRRKILPGLIRLHRARQEFDRAGKFRTGKQY
jgi:hypothetical protein